MPSPMIAAALSLLFPGLGQAYAGARTRGLLLALPWGVLLGGVAYLVLSGRIIDIVSHPETMLATLVFLAAVFMYHAAVIIDAYGVASREWHWSGARTPRYGVGVVVLLIVLLLVPYGVVEVYGIQFNDAIEDIAGGNSGAIPPPDFGDDETPTPTEGTPTPSPTTSAPPVTPTPATTGSPGTSPDSGSPPASPAGPTPVAPSYGPIDAPWADNDRLDLLLIGADSGAGRTSVRTDTMILVSVDIATGRAAMFGFPRNMTDVPLPEESRGGYPEGTFPDLLNALWRRAAEQPENFSGSQGIGRACAMQWDCERGWRAISGAIQNMAGVPLDGIIAVDLQGFALLVDAVGGVWIDVPAPVVDPQYRIAGRNVPIDIEPGCQKLDGTHALAYARSRRQDSDYQRMRRQQFVLRAIRRQFDPLAMLPRVPELLNIARDNLYTTIDRDDIPLMAQVASRVDADRIEQIRFQQRDIRNVTPESIRTMRQRVRTVFEGPAPTPSPTPGRDGERCPPR